MIIWLFLTTIWSSFDPLNVRVTGSSIRVRFREPPPQSQARWRRRRGAGCRTTFKPWLGPAESVEITLAVSSTDAAPVSPGQPGRLGPSYESCQARSRQKSRTYSPSHCLSFSAAPLGARRKAIARGTWACFPRPASVRRPGPLHMRRFGTTFWSGRYRANWLGFQMSSDLREDGRQPSQLRAMMCENRPLNQPDGNRHNFWEHW